MLTFELISTKTRGPHGPHFLYNTTAINPRTFCLQLKLLEIFGLSKVAYSRIKQAEFSFVLLYVTLKIEGAWK